MRWSLMTSAAEVYCAPGAVGVYSRSHSRAMQQLESATARPAILVPEAALHNATSYEKSSLNSSCTIRAFNDPRCAADRR